MTKLLQDKYSFYSSNDIYVYPGGPLTKNKYGFICLENPHNAQDDDERELLLRKPTPQERKEIIVNTIIECKGKTFKISNLAFKLGVSERTVQKILRQLEEEKLIEIIPQYDINGKQTRNAYRYIGPPCKKYGSGLTLRILYNPKINVGIRNWPWKEFEFRHNKIWHSNYKLCKAKFDQHVARRKYLEKFNLPLIVPKDVKHLVLRYCYWKGEDEKLWDDELFSRDGTVKLDVFPLDRTEKIRLFGYTLLIEFGGTKENPQVTITDANAGKQLGVFTWFDRNIIQSSKRINKDLVEQFFILGDFTTK